MRSRQKMEECLSTIYLVLLMIGVVAPRDLSLPTLNFICAFYFLLLFIQPFCYHPILILHILLKISKFWYILILLILLLNWHPVKSHPVNFSKKKINTSIRIKIKPMDLIEF